MRVSLLTLHRVRNYGSVLQSLATQNLLRQLGHDVTVIDYWRPDLLDSAGDYFARSRWARYPFMRIPFRIAKGKWLRRNREVFNSFVESHLSLTRERYYSIDDLARLPSADIYIVGSDQVWNEHYNRGSSDPFFLAFAPPSARKVSFSSSFGTHELPSATENLARLHLPHFEAISVRESHALKVLKDLGLESQHTLDPTLAIGPEFWESFATVDSIGSPGILTYQLNPSDNFDRTVRSLEAKFGLRSTRIDIRHAGRSTRSRRVQPKISDWVGLFRGASHVVTDSFHGVAFSLIFERPFTVILPPTHADRISSLLEVLGLERRVSNGVSDLDDDPIDWDKVSYLLQSMRLDSQQFLRRATCG